MKKYEKIIPEFTKKPWGSFWQFIQNHPCTVKILNLNPKEELSLQYHYKRDEFWFILDGEGEILIGTKILKAVKGKKFYIFRKTKHQAKALANNLQILEISLGQFEEKDIVRLSDKYNRLNKK
jgi:mannose-6-phosphate isomerase-like protein (cupin superfamily)